MRRLGHLRQLALRTLDELLMKTRRVIGVKHHDAGNEIGTRRLHVTDHDAVIVDLIMPNVDGFRLIALIRSTPGLSVAW